ncbi:MAG: purine-binding chemotaxis protein CheW [Spirochaetes bacterium]|nr:purine-binding chemotaxis protein CheW [Spirochaetota bacterium]
MNDVVNKEKNKIENIDNQQFVTFFIGKEIYGVDVLRVQEIIGITEITFVPNSLPFMKGVINLRGNVVPVLDMRKKLNMPDREYDQTTVIIIVEVKGRSIGMIVDAVSDVIDITTESIQNTPHFTAKIETDYIKSIGRKDDDLIIMLEVDKILSTDDLESITVKES